MNQQEIDEIYYTLESLCAILWLFSNIEEVNSKYISTISIYYYKKLEIIISKMKGKI